MQRLLHGLGSVNSCCKIEDRKLRKIIPTVSIRVFWTVLLSTSIFSSLAYGEIKQLGFAVPFPDLIFKQTLSEEELAYLGLVHNRDFSFEEIRGKVILVQLMSTYCGGCQRQAPIFNKVYDWIENDPQLKGKVKIIGIAAGNNEKEVSIFKRQYKIPYPILTDVKFETHTAVGSPRTPYTIWVRKDGQGKGIVVSTHLGAFESGPNALDETRAVLQYDLTLLTLKEGPIYQGDALNPPLTGEELMAKAREGMEASGGKVLQIERISLQDGDWIYLGKMDFGTHQEVLFSKLASRRAICDICHDTYFIYTFDREGIIIEIVPIQLTKFGNVKWTEEDLKKLRSRTVGRSLFEPFTFDPGVDSITSATITAMLVFDSLSKAKEIYEKLKKEGYVK